MYVMMDTEVMYPMSAVIGVCSQKYFIIFGDKRLVRFDPRSANVSELVSDDFPKVFRVNRNVAFGATGLLSSRNEDLQRPLLRLANKALASLQDVKECLVQYLQSSDFDFVRNYVVGGKLPDGTCGVYELQWDPITHEVREKYVRPHAAETKITMLLPGLAVGKSDYFLSRIQEALSVTYVDEALPKLLAIIGEVADCDPSVGRTGTVVTIL